MAKRGMMKSTYRRMLVPITIQDIIRDIQIERGRPGAAEAFALAIQKAGGRAVTVSKL